MKDSSSRSIIILLGAPGAGKGTLAAMICQRLGLAHIASGDLFREALERGTELGFRAKSYMEKGQLVPDEVTIEMVLGRIAAPDCTKGFVLDGYPRTLEQVQALDVALGREGEAVNKVLYLEVSTEEVVRRLSGRWVCRICQTPYHEVNLPPKVAGKCDRCGGELYQRPDDSEATVRGRLDVYSSQTRPIIDYYEKVGKLVEINGEGGVEGVAERLMAVLS